MTRMTPERASKLADKAYKASTFPGQTFSQIAVRYLHDNLGDLQGKIEYATTFGSRPGYPVVWSGQLEADVVVSGSSYPDLVLYGWLPRSEVEKGPVTWKTINGERVDYGHRLHKDAFYPFTGQVLCDHSAAVWSYAQKAWRCFGCDLLLYCRADELMIERQDVQGFSNRGDHPA